MEVQLNQIKWEGKVKNRFLKQASREYTPNQRLTALVFLSPVFLFLLPYAIIILGRRLDEGLGLGPILPDPSNVIVGAGLALPGWIFGFWSIYSQFTRGRGTPVPLMATQKLIVEPPYTYCRNPMVLGTLGAYMGAAFLFQTAGGAIVVTVGTAVLLIYVKVVEEKEMVLRFGDEYLAYKRRTPFLIPRFWK